MVYKKKLKNKKKMRKNYIVSQHLIKYSIKTKPLSILKHDTSTNST